MKKAFCLLLALSFFLSACHVLGEPLKDPVTFYYINSEYEYFSQEGIITSEQRDASGHRNDLPYLLALYMMGPAEEGLESPLPKGVMLFKAEESEEGILIHISSHDTMTDASFSLSCACLALTCFDITDASSVTVNSGDRSITLTRDTISLFDSSIAAEESP